MQGSRGARIGFVRLPPMVDLSGAEGNLGDVEDEVGEAAADERFAWGGIK